MTSWVRIRRYVVTWGDRWRYILDEFQELECPRGDGTLVGRLTHIWAGGGFPDEPREEYHYNLKESMGAAENLWLTHADDQSWGLFPSDQAVVLIVKQQVPTDVQKRWPTLTKDEIIAHGKPVGPKVSEWRL